VFWKKIKMSKVLYLNNLKGWGCFGANHALLLLNNFCAETSPPFNNFFNLKNFYLEENTQLKNTIKRLEESIDKAAQVISEYSNAFGEQQCSAVDYLQLKHELTKLQTENERLLSKMDQLKHEATQEQRLITQNWYQSVRFFLLKDR
jgi:predicted nuclease with TOPRIM domain